jgi:hypothetical protein
MSALTGAVAVTAHGYIGVLAIAAAMLGFRLFSTFCSILVERSVMGFRRLKPECCSIYDHYFWQHQRLWKLLTGAPFGGTPLSRCSGECWASKSASGSTTPAPA